MRPGSEHECATSKGQTCDEMKNESMLTARDQTDRLTDSLNVLYCFTARRVVRTGVPRTRVWRQASAPVTSQIRITSLPHCTKKEKNPHEDVASTCLDSCQHITRIGKHVQAC